MSAAAADHSDNSNDTKKRPIGEMSGKVESKTDAAKATTTADSSATTILFVTGNKNKLSEVKQFLEAPKMNNKFIVDNIKMDLPEFQGSPEEITTRKVKVAFEEVRKPVLVEDTSLGFKALGDLPGPYIKYFLDSMGVDGLPNLLKAYEDKSATAMCIFGYWDGLPGTEPMLFKGTCEGNIVAARGAEAFGWDPVFEPIDETTPPREPAGSKLTFAEMSTEQKSSISHRGRALIEAAEYFMKLASSEEDSSSSSSSQQPSKEGEEETAEGGSESPPKKVKKDGE